MLCALCTYPIYKAGFTQNGSNILNYTHHIQYSLQSDDYGCLSIYTYIQLLVKLSFAPPLPEESPKGQKEIRSLS